MAIQDEKMRSLRKQVTNELQTDMQGYHDHESSKDIRCQRKLGEGKGFQRKEAKMKVDAKYLREAV